MIKWKETIKTVLKWKVDLRVMAVLAAIGLVLVLVPLIRLSTYSAPWYDDYNYAKDARNFLLEERSLKSAYEGAVYCTKTNWYAWQGTFSSIMFMSLSPMIWGEEYYFLGPLFLIFLMPVSVCVLGKVFLRNVLKVDRASAVIVCSVAAGACVMLMHSAQDGFFWYNAGVHYLGMHSFLLLLTAAWIKLLAGGRKISYIFTVLWTMLGALLAGGANYVTALQGGMVLMVLMVFGMLLRNRRVLLMLPSVAIYGYAFYKNVTAQDNAVRKRIFEGIGKGMDALPAIGNSFLEAFRHLGQFTGVMMPAVMLLLVPVIWKMVRKTKVRFRFPGLVLLGSFCLYAAGFTPSLYAMSTSGLARTLNAVKLTYQILLLINEVYWLGWLQGRLDQWGQYARLGWLREGLAARDGRRQSVFFFGAVGMLMLGIFLLESNPGRYYSSYGAYHFVHTGEADNFYREYLARVETLKNSGPDVVLEPYHWKPWFICVGDLSEDPEAEQNRAVAGWYWKESVRVAPRE